MNGSMSPYRGDILLHAHPVRITARSGPWIPMNSNPSSSSRTHGKKQWSDNQVASSSFTTGEDGRTTTRAEPAVSAMSINSTTDDEFTKLAGRRLLKTSKNFPQERSTPELASRITSTVNRSVIGSTNKNVLAVRAIDRMETDVQMYLREVLKKHTSDQQTILEKIKYYGNIVDEEEVVHGTPFLHKGLSTYDLKKKVTEIIADCSCDKDNDDFDDILRDYEA